MPRGGLESPAATDRERRRYDERQEMDARAEVSKICDSVLGQTDKSPG